MAENKTKKTEASVADFLQNITDPGQRELSLVLLEMMRKAVKREPKMWGTGIIGFGDYHYKYESGREGDWFLMGFAPRKGKTTLYFMCGMHEHKELLSKLGKFKTGAGCLYINKLADVDMKVLRQLVDALAKTGGRKKSA